MQEPFIDVALENADERNSACGGDVLSRGIVADIKLAARDLRRERREGSVVSSRAGENRVLDAFSLFDADSFVDQNRRAGFGERV